MSTQLDRDITKGNIAGFAKNIAHLQYVSDKELAEILKEIADLLHPKEVHNESGDMVLSTQKNSEIVGKESEEKEEWPCVRGNTCRMLECKPDDWDIRGKIAGIGKPNEDNHDHGTSKAGIKLSCSGCWEGVPRISKDLPPLPEELIVEDWTVKETFEAINAIIRFLKARE